MITWPDDLIEAAARRRAIFFLGSGVSRNSEDADGKRPPLWEGFLNSLLPFCGAKTQEIKSYMKANDYLTACELIRKRLDDQWEKKLEEVFLNPKYKPAPIHEAIFKVDLSIVMTTNVDRIYDLYAEHETHNVVRIKSYYDDDVGRAVRGASTQRLILKVHGCASTPQKAVFTRVQYANAVKQHASFYRLVEGLISTHTIVFLGCGLADPDINLMLEGNARAFVATPPHYLVTSTTMSSDLESMYKDNYNLKTIKYKDRDNHKEMIDSVFHFAELVEEARERMAV